MCTAFGAEFILSRIGEVGIRIRAISNLTGEAEAYAVRMVLFHPLSSGHSVSSSLIVIKQKFFFHFCGARMFCRPSQHPLLDGLWQGAEVNDTLVISRPAAYILKQA
jgi:hypothetical protein